MADPKEFDGKLEKIANLIADRILATEPVDKELTDTFKALSGYQASSRKLDKVLFPDDDTKEGFGGIKRRLEAV